MNAVQTSIADFCAHMDMLEKTLKDFTEETLREERRIFEPLERAGGKFVLQKSGGHTKAVRRLMEEYSGMLRENLSAWREQVERGSKVRDILKEYANKALVVAVFGATNVGKSTLGNFLRGKPMLAAPFPTPYNPDDGSVPFAFSKITVVQKEGDAPDETGEDWFETGAMETTRAAQIFSGHGLTWLDTPGFGSTDEKLGALAQSYVRQADLIVCLDSSDAPGLRGHASRIREFLGKERKVCVVITHSDKMVRCEKLDGTFEKDEQGKILKKRVGKDPEARAAQEKQEIDALKGRMEGKEYECDATAVSISTLLAEEGVQEGDEEKYKQSNIEAFFKELRNVLPDRDSVLMAKRSGPLQAMIELLNKILEETPNSNGLAKAMGKIREEIVRLEKISENVKIDDSTRAVTRAVLTDVNPVLRQEVDRAVNGATGNEISVDITSVKKAASVVARARTNERAERILKDLWDKAAEGGEALDFDSLGGISMKRKVDTYEYEATEPQSYVRSPDGLWEHVKSWFGETYYGTRIVKVKKTGTVDLGFDADEAAAEIRGELEKSVSQYAQEELRAIKEQCLDSLIHMLEEGESALREARDELQKFQEELKARC